VIVLVETTVPMYLIGGPHVNKGRVETALREAVQRGDRLVTDAEVLQEICHRYTAIRRREAIAAAYAVLLGVVDEVHSVDLAALELTKDLLLEDERHSARDALHVAVMRRHDISHVLSFDRDYDSFPGIIRLPEDATR
jgi:predicted nucleic acid-binding protein